MHLEVTFRNSRPREEVKRRAQALFTKLERFLDPATEATLVVTSEHGSRITELTVTSLDGVHTAHDEDEDLRTALDRTFHKIETSLRRAKEKRVDRHHRRAEKLEGFVVEAGADDEEEEMEQAV
ncbi:MAG: HPF/RaiA family ribosome-associated protein [Alphaproteobacteria bacterium]|nr:HPF/RaiA family ribosome-associated protein [Alphaproteobacteria bacterium]